MVIDEEAKDKIRLCPVGYAKDMAPGPTMRELRDKGMSKPYRDRRKRSKYTKSVNVPYFSLCIEEESGEPEEQNNKEE